MDLSRRDFLRLTGAVGAGAGLTALLDACGSTAAPVRHGAPKSTAPANMKMEWWGNSDRASRTNQVINLFQLKNQQYQITGQSFGWADYWKDVAAKWNQPGALDILQMDMRYINQYVSQKSLLELSNYVPDQLDIKNIDKGLMTQAQIKGFYAVPNAGNIQAIMYDATALQAAGVTPLTGSFSWQDWGSWLSQLGKKLPSGVYPIENFSGDIAPFEVYVRGFGHEMYTADGKVNWTRDEALSWFQFWDDLRQSGVVAPYAVSHRNNNLSTAQEGMPKGKTVMEMAFSNFLDQYSNFMKDTLVPGAQPRGPKGHPGTYVKVSQMWCVTSTCTTPSQAVQFINFLINDVDAGKALQLERGTPPSTVVAAALRPTLPTLDQGGLDFFARERTNTTPKTVLDPPGAGDFQAAMYPVSDALAQGQITIQAAADQLMAAGLKTIGG